MNKIFYEINPELKKDIDEKFNHIIENIRSTNKQRTDVYNYNHYLHGNVMAALFPKGITLKTPEDWNKYSIINIMVAKLSRYATYLSNTGQHHQDSIHDNAVYSIMLEEMIDRYEAIEAIQNEFSIDDDFDDE